MIIFAGKRALPHRPHLDHLRKQAKARLSEMRAARPDAHLAEAQLTLAREYGFSNWGTLRAEVSRRAAAQRDRRVRAPHRRAPRAGRYREGERPDLLLEQATPLEPQSAFILAGAATNVGVLF